MAALRRRRGEVRRLQKRGGSTFKHKEAFSFQVATGDQAGPDRAAAKRAFDAMMEMTKIDIARIEAALRG